MLHYFLRKKGKNFYSTRVGKKTYLLLQNRNLLFELNPTSSLIWEKLKDKMTVDDLVRELEKKFDISTKDQTAIKKDVLEFLDFLQKKHLLETSS